MKTMTKVHNVKSSLLTLASALAVAVTAACDAGSTADPPEIAATGTVSGTVVNDVDGTRGASPGDVPISDVIVRAAYRGTTTADRDRYHRWFWLIRHGSTGRCILDDSRLGHPR